MKNSMLKLLVLLILPFAFSNLMAQAEMPIDPDADKLLSEVSAKYKAYKSAKIELDLIIDYPEVENDESISVTTWLKGDKFKIELPDQVFISDNVTMWNYMKEYDEVQINNFEEADALFSPSVIFDMYNDKYIYRMKEEYKKDGVLFQVVELVPVNKEEEYFKIDLTINMSNKTIAKSKIYEKSGTNFTYKINKFTPNVDLADDFFYLDTSKIDNVVDLRY